MNAVFSCRAPRKKVLPDMIKKVIFFLAFVAISLILIYNFQIIPALIPFAEAKTATTVTAEVQKIIRETVGTDYGSFVSLKYDAQGNVVSLETNAAALSAVTAKITENIITSLSNNDRLSVEIPLGSLSGGALMTGRGPDISIPIAVSPKVICEIDNEFYESGINQTLHSIVAEVTVETYALIPASPRKITVETEYCIAETVIVGKVPDAYTKINRATDDITESEIDDIYDFGAAAD